MRVRTSFSDLANVVERDYTKNMGYLFVPYNGESPAPVWINGHKLLILSLDGEDLSRCLKLIGADSVKRIKAGSTPEEQTLKLAKLAKKVDGGILIAPNELEVTDLLKNLEQQLPWVQ